MEDLLELLKIHYGYTKLRLGQDEAIGSVLSGQSTVLIMPTGGGKSLCYQLPALVLDGVTIVVSPLIALMKDQVDSLNKIGIPATFVNSSISPNETDKRLNDIKQGRYKLLYVAPERFYSKDFNDALSHIKVSLFAVDEAHCISQWGHDFRPSYMRLRDALKAAGHPVVMALTATATPEVRQDIIRQLGLEDPKIIITGFARSNLQFGAIQTNDNRKASLALEVINNSPEGSGIVYIGTRSRADELLQYLLENDVEAVAYHAGMDPESRDWIQNQFMTGKAKVIVATNAFGMGIDKRDIRFVIHYDMPGTIEAYYQEAGRAGRDGKTSVCLLLYSARDKFLQEFFIKGDNPTPDIILNIYEALLEYGSDRVLITYSEIKRLLGDDFPEMAVGTALKILEKEGYIYRAKEKSGQATIKIDAGFETISEAIGRKSKKQLELADKLMSRYADNLKEGWQTNMEDLANLVGCKKDALTRLFKKLEKLGLADYQPPFKGTEINILKRVSREDVEIDFTALKEKLRFAYEKLDKMENYVYDTGCRQSYILKYFGETDFVRCGQCDNCISDSKLRSQAVFTDDVPEIQIGRKLKKSGESVEFNTKTTQMETYDLYLGGLSLIQIAQDRNLKPATIVEHLGYLMEVGIPIEISRFVKPDKENAIIRAIEEAGTTKQTPIKERLGEDYSWDEIKLVLAKYKASKKVK